MTSALPNPAVSVHSEYPAAALPNAVLTQVQAILTKDAEADRIALVWPEPIEPRELRRQLSDTRLRVVYCPSELAMRELLEGLVAPLAKQQPVLVLVLDGMSQAVYRELAGDLLHDGWVELQPADSTGPCCLLAALPTITRISRYALLAGTLGEGGGADEKKAFAAHPALKRLSSTKCPPRLFHKVDLQQAGSGALAEEVREVIAGQSHKVVGAVINAVDDQLSSGAQVSVRWSVASIGVLRRILEAARESRRLVILTSACTDSWRACRSC